MLIIIMEAPFTYIYTYNYIILHTHIPFPNIPWNDPITFPHFCCFQWKLRISAINWGPRTSSPRCRTCRRSVILFKEKGGTWFHQEEHPEVDFFLNISFGPKLIHNKHENCQQLQGKWMVLVPETWPSIPSPSEIPVVQGAIDQHREDQI